MRPNHSRQISRVLYFQLEEGAIKEDGEGKEEPDFIETHCHWKDCDREYGTQDDLVKVSPISSTYKTDKIVNCIQIEAQ